MFPGSNKDFCQVSKNTFTSTTNGVNPTYAQWRIYLKISEQSVLWPNLLMHNVHKPLPKINNIVNHRDCIIANYIFDFTVSWICNNSFLVSMRTCIIP